MTDNLNNQFSYLPHTDHERQEMLKAIGVSSFDELVKHIPDEIRACCLELPDGLSEQELTAHVAALAAKNKPASKQSCFLGGGSYRRFVPAAVSTIVSRSEFATAYTPYQPEVSQGTLQIIYEFQTAICLLTGMAVANASMYDGPTAAAEAALMASRLTGRRKVVLAGNINPEHKQVLTTYAWSCGLELEIAPCEKGTIGSPDLKLDCSTAALIIQHPNYFGCLEDLPAIASRAHAVGALMIVVSEPISLGLLRSPGECGADIVVGDAQPCGNNLTFGGPSAGYVATRQEFVRQLPGRLVGATVDNRGQSAFTLTLQTREQHIRRAKATSNICTNQALNALTMLVYLTLVGPQGLRELAEVSVRRAHYLADLLGAIPGVKLLYNESFFNEFAIRTPLPARDVLEHLKGKGILGGLDLGKFDPALDRAILVAVTEMNSPKELDNYGVCLSALLASAREKTPAELVSRSVNG